MGIQFLKNAVCILLIIFENFTIYAFNDYYVGSRSMSLSGCGVTNSDVWSVSHNQAGLAQLSTDNLGLYHEQRFLMKELSLSSLAFACPIKPGTMGLQMNYFGYSLYHEMKLGMAFSSKLGKNIMAGVQLDYFSSTIANSTHQDKRITFEAGIISLLTENIKIGFHVFNPILKKENTNTEVSLPSIVQFGGAYTIKSEICIMAEAEYNYIQKPFIKIGIEYNPINSLALRIGISTGTIPYSFGIGYHWKKYIAGFGFANHPELGTTPSFDLLVSF